MRWAAILTLAAAVGTAQAQAIDPNAAVNAASRIVQLIDAGRSDEVWEGASESARQVVDKQRFTADVAAARQARGAPSLRQWVGVTRREAVGSQALPAGVYLSVEFETRFASGTLATELVSFKQDPDKTWRVTGYVLK